METVSESLLEATKQIVEQEIREAQQAHNEKYKDFGSNQSYKVAARYYLNNFDFNFVRNGQGANNYRLMDKNHFDLKYSDWIEQQKEEYKKKGWGEYSDTHWSELRKSKTPKEFFEDIDNAAIAEGFDLDQLEKEIKGFSHEHGDAYCEFEAKKMLKVYIRLIAMGYNADDLCT